MSERSTENPMSQPKRRLVAGGVAAAALAAGVGLAWWRLQPDEDPDTNDLLWSLSFQTPQGQDLPMKALRGRPLLLNFWATWCPPCVEEMPLLDAFFRQNMTKGWLVLGLAIDQPSAVRTFLARAPVSYMIGLAGMQGTELTRSLGNRTGGLPYTVVIGVDGHVRHRRMGRVSEDDLRHWVQLA